MAGSKKRRQQRRHDPAGDSEPREPRDRLVTRRDLAGWVEGTQATTGRWPGERLGLAQQGPTSMAPMGRRILALFIDWLLAALVSNTWFDGNMWITLGLFAGMHVLLLATLGTTIGKRLTGLQVVRVGGRTAGPVKTLVRTALLCLVLPAVVVDPDGRPFHDRWAGTVQIRM